MDATPEAIVATIGIGRFLDGTARLHRYVVDDAAALPMRITRDIRAFLASEHFSDPEPKLPEFDFTEVSRLLLETGNHAQAEAIKAGFPDTDLADQVIAVASRIIEYLQERRPGKVRETMTGPVDHRPTDQQIAAFRRLYHVANDPTIVIADLAEGSLSRGQVRAVKDLYPELYRQMGAAVAAGVTAARAGKSARWTLPRRKELALETLLDRSSLAPGQLQALQQGFAKKDQPRARAGGGGGQDPEKLLTPGQKHA